ncbi:biotin transporter BioY [Aliiruegeria sabulilitoris]|uniref:biotin transporter BioY n=1 Tax=Aliiruegeria sabulilitoris TaxID=1510458 RepID=UPI00082F28DD|nr:biotin transporter BioY [Aliiruegeria sabulilitoris]NDR58998.1 BioY family transporter [Pseudoruegeria sp. M32A2M]
MERNITLIALFAALIAVLGLIPKLTLISGIPITAQSLGIMLCGTVLGARRGALAVLLFLLLVALGLPLLAGGRGGLGVFAGPTVGFLVGWVVGAYVIGLLTSGLTSLPVGVAAGVASVIGGIVVLYIPGVIGMMVMLDMSVQKAFLSILPFIPGDLLKAVLAGAITATLARARPGVVASRPAG